MKTPKKPRRNFADPVGGALNVLWHMKKSGRDHLYAQGRLPEKEVKIIEDAVYAVLDHWKSNTNKRIPYWFTQLCVSLEHFGGVTHYSTIEEGKYRYPHVEYTPSKFSGYLHA